MAQQTIVELIDDLDGKSAAAETVAFGLDGVTFEIDLSETNAERLRGIFGDFIPHARRVGGRKQQRKVTASSVAAGGKASPDAALIREWANANGYGLPERGRIAAHVVEAYWQAKAEEAGAAEKPKARRRRPAAKARK